MKKGRGKINIVLSAGLTLLLIIFLSAAVCACSQLNKANPGNISKNNNELIPGNEKTDSAVGVQEAEKSNLQLNYIKMFSKSTGWGIDSGRVLKTMDGGKTWYDSTPVVSDISLTVSPVWKGYFLSSSIGWVILISPQGGNSTIVYHTIDGGRNWLRSVIKENSIESTSLFFLDAKKGWAFLGQDVAMGHELTTLYGTDDGGNTWKKLSTTGTIGDMPKSIPFYGLKSGFVFRNSLSGYVAGEIPSGNDVMLYATKDGGITWERHQLALPGKNQYNYLMLNPPQFFSLNTGIMGGRFNGEKFIFYKTNDGGAQWSIVSQLKTTGSPAYTFLNSKYGWYIDNGDVSMTKDGGKTWTVLVNDSRLAEVNKIEFADQKTGWASANGGLFKTTDGGKNWFYISPSIIK